MHAAPIEILEVVRDGAPEPYHASLGPGPHPFQRILHVRTGQPIMGLGEGQHVWRISYRIKGKIASSGALRRLTYDATGENSPSCIDHASITVHLPSTAIPTPLAPGRERVAAIGPGLATLETTQGPYNGQGFRPSRVWPRGAAPDRPLLPRVRPAIEDNWPAVASLGLLMLFAALCLLLRLRHAAPEHARATSPALPEGLSAAPVRFVDGKGFDLRTVSVAILDLAALGRIAIGRYYGNHVLLELDHTVSVEPDEAGFADLLFADRRPRWLSDEDRFFLMIATRRLQAALEASFWTRRLRTDRRAATAVLAAGLGILVAVPLFFQVSEGGDRGLLALACLWLCSAIVALFLWLSRGLAAKQRWLRAAWFVSLGLGSLFNLLLTGFGSLDGSIPL